MAFSETMQARRECSEIFKVLEVKKNHQYKLYILKKLSFKCEEEIKTFSDKQNLREFIDNSLAPREMLKEVLQAEAK